MRHEAEQADASQEGRRAAPECKQKKKKPLYDPKMKKFAQLARKCVRLGRELRERKDAQRGREQKHEQARETVDEPSTSKNGREARSASVAVSDDDGLDEGTARRRRC